MYSMNKGIFNYVDTEKRLTCDLLRIFACSEEVPMGHDGPEL